MTIPASTVQHTRSNQVSLGGYAKGQLVMHGGVLWRSLVSNNLSIPGESSTWDLAG